jgi:hypothetical protein
MEYRWKINLAGTLPDGHTPDLTITPQSKAITNRLKEPLKELVYRFQKKRERQHTPTDTRMGKLWLMQTLIL